MAMFTIIAALQDEYKKTDASRAGIKLLLQDPNYEIRDHLLLQRLWPGKKEDLVFVSDPDGLLAIDAGMIVARVRNNQAIGRLITGLGLERSPSGPAMIIGDKMNVDPAKASYSLQERGAPHVARFLSQRYEKIDSGFEDHGLEDEFGDDVFGKRWMHRNQFYWLNDMELWAKVSREQ
ncbi:hypothetical protein TUN205_11536 [Pyrenophora tritici-repentis]|nr:hypothetical protein TUN205_11536 [Pyrenophora tritici-repentis]